MLGKFCLSRSIIYRTFSLLDNAPLHLGCQRGTWGFCQRGKVWLTLGAIPSSTVALQTWCHLFTFVNHSMELMQQYERLVFIWESNCQIKWWQMEKLSAVVSGVWWRPSALVRSKYINLSWCLQKIHVQPKDRPRILFYLINTPYWREHRMALELKHCY